MVLHQDVDQTFFEVWTMFLVKNWPFYSWFQHNISSICDSLFYIILSTWGKFKCWNWTVLTKKRVSETVARLFQSSTNIIFQFYSVPPPPYNPNYIYPTRKLNFRSNLSDHNHNQSPSQLWYLCYVPNAQEVNISTDLSNYGGPVHNGKLITHGFFLIARITNKNKHLSLQTLLFSIEHLKNDWLTSLSILFYKLVYIANKK